MIIYRKGLLLQTNGKIERGSFIVVEDRIELVKTVDEFYVNDRYLIEECTLILGSSTGVFGKEVIEVPYIDEFIVGYELLGNKILPLAYSFKSREIPEEFDEDSLEYRKLLYSSFLDHLRHFSK